MYMKINWRACWIFVEASPEITPNFFLPLRNE